jgi:hypothetical protein
MQLYQLVLITQELLRNKLTDLYAGVLFFNNSQK